MAYKFRNQSFLIVYIFEICENLFSFKEYFTPLKFRFQ